MRESPQIKKTPYGVFFNWAAVDCLARSRLTAISCFAYRFSIFGKSTPASALSRSNHQKVVLILLTALKKDRNKSYPFLMGRSGLSCSFAFNGNSAFCFSIFNTSQNSPASAHSRSNTIKCLRTWRSHRLANKIK